MSTLNEGIGTAHFWDLTQMSDPIPGGGFGWEHTSWSATSCPNVDRCPMFPRFRSDSPLRVIQSLYREGAYERCERYRLASQGTMPDPRPLPDGRRLE